MNEQRLQEIKERASKATTGPWKVYQDEFSTLIGSELIHPQLKAPMPVVAEAHYDEGIVGIHISADDAEFIANAREDVPVLIAEVERLQGKLENTEILYRTYEKGMSKTFDKFEEAQGNLKQAERAAAKHYQDMLSWRKAWKRKRKEAKVLANACRKHKEHIAQLEKENERLRAVLREIYKETLFADVVPVRLKDIHEIACKGLAGE